MIRRTVWRFSGLFSNHLTTFLHLSTPHHYRPSHTWINLFFHITSTERLVTVGKHVTSGQWQLARLCFRLSERQRLWTGSWPSAPEEHHQDWCSLQAEKEGSKDESVCLLWTIWLCVWEDCWREPVIHWLQQTFFPGTCVATLSLSLIPTHKHRWQGMDKSFKG